MEVLHTQERIEHSHAAHNKRNALIIIVLAVALAIIEMAGKEAQFTSIATNIETADLYSFYQAKTIRVSLLRTMSENAALLGPPATPEQAEARQKQLDAWKSDMERLNSEPSTGEGRKELIARAKEKEAERDHEIHAYHDFEFASASLQLAIVLASAAVITGIVALEFVAGGLGAVGVLLALFGWFAPSLLGL